MKNSFYNAWKERRSSLDAVIAANQTGDSTPTAELEHRLEMACADYAEYEQVRGDLREAYPGKADYRAALKAEVEARAAMLELAADDLAFRLDESESDEFDLAQANAYNGAI